MPVPPPPSRGRVIAIIGIAILVIAGIGAGIGFAVERATNPAASSVDAGVVDITSNLGGGNAAAGTGMILKSSGEVLTNNHVIAGALSIHVDVPSTGNSYSASVTGVDPTDDVALIQLQNASGLPTMALGDSSQVAVGDSVIAIGNALGRGGPPVLTQGAVTAVGQTITASDAGGANPETLTNMIQFSANIQPGDSGGPLVNHAGAVVGMDTAGAGRIRIRQLGTDVGFAIPINAAISIVHDMENGTANPNVVHGSGAFLGVDVQDNNSPRGALVIAVEPGTPAEAGGIAPQDVITEVGGRAVTSLASLRIAIQQHKPGERVVIRWVDPSGAQHNATIQLSSGAPP